MKKSDSLKIEQWSIDKVLPYARNSRIHSDEQVDSIAASIREFGFVNPCLVDANGVLIAGHGRVMAARRLDMATVPVIKLGYLTEDQAKALRIADNQLPTLAAWNEEMLRVELNDLSQAGYSLSLLGFEDTQLVSFMASVPSGDVDPDETPEPPEKPVSRPGDLWQLGKHRVICGDSTDAEVVARLIGKDKPHLMVTDQPYGIEYDAGWRNRQLKKQDRAEGAVHNDDRADWREAWELFGGDVAYVWTSDLRSRESIEALESVGLMPRAQIIWMKEQLVVGRGDYHFQHEPCWYTVRKGKTGHWAGDRKQSTVWQIEKPKKSDSGHSTQKPVECMRLPIQNNSKAGEFVYDPFLGSGTTLIAAEVMTRYCLGIEINPAYVDVAIDRWQTFSKSQAVLIDDGRTFAEVAKARRKKTPAVKAGAKSKGRKVNQAAE